MGRADGAERLVFGVRGTDPDIKRHGRVLLREKSARFLGAEIASNNTAEITAFGESLLYLFDVKIVVFLFSYEILNFAL